MHKWARERPDMSIAEQSLWSEAAAELLSCCILTIPFGNTTEDENLRRTLLPHIQHVRTCQVSIEQQMKERRMTRLKTWPVLDGGFNEKRAGIYAKFGSILAQNGCWDEAKRLQSAVRDFTMQVWGIGHVEARRSTLKLSITLGWLGESHEAVALQEQVLDACMTYRSAHHHETLVAKCTLGDSRYWQAFYSDARKLQEEALTGLMRLHGLYHEDTLSAMDSLGRTMLMFSTQESIKRARELHLQAVNGMRKVHGNEHLRTHVACENLCMAATRSGDRTYLNDAHEMMTEILETRKKKLGREHRFTFVSMINLARVKCELGNLNGAEQLILQAMLIAEHIFDPCHKAYLWTRCHLAKIYVRQKRWEEAQWHLADVTERQRNILHGRGQYFPERLGGLVELAAAYHALGRFQECNKVVDEALAGFEYITISTGTSIAEHPVAKKLNEDRKMWMEESMGVSMEVAEI